MDSALRTEYEKYLTKNFGLSYASTQVMPDEVGRFAAWFAVTPYAEVFEELREGIAEELGLIISLGYQWHWNIETAAHLYLDEHDFQETGLDYWSRVRSTVQGAARSLLKQVTDESPETERREFLLALAPLISTRLQLPDSGRGMALCLTLLVSKIGIKTFCEDSSVEDA